MINRFNAKINEVSKLNHAIEALQQFKCLCKNKLGNNLIGVYLHGSLAMDCYNRTYSDIDLLVIIHHNLTSHDKRQFISEIINIENNLDVRIEMSILLQESLFPLQYPIAFELHYSKDHRARYHRDASYLCENGKDDDLAAHIVVTHERGKVLYGEAITSVFPDIDRKMYLVSIRNDVADASNNIIYFPVYYCLNLCRVDYFMKENKVTSKKEAGEWALKHLPARFHHCIELALDVYISEIELETKWDQKQLTAFANTMLEAINRNIREKK